MKKVALVFVLAVFVPSLVLAWLAVRSLRDQQFLLEKQQSLLYQGVADVLAKQVADSLADYQRTFVTEAAALLRGQPPEELARIFDDLLRKDWPLAQVGFVVTLSGNILCPSPQGRADARTFFTCNNRFLANRESAEVYWNPKFLGNSASDLKKGQALSPGWERNELSANSNIDASKISSLNKFQSRSVVPQQAYQKEEQFPSKINLQKQVEESGNISKVAPSETEFRQLIGDDSEGTLARFVDDKLTFCSGTDRHAISNWSSERNWLCRA